jgi:hypothetical protein
LKKPIVSVIIPVYNKREYIEETICSVLRQELKDLEIIIINDGSTDESLDVVGEIKDKRLRVFSQPNFGVERARNFGFSQSVGSFIVFLDADDLMKSNRLIHQLQLFNSNENLVLVGTWANVIDKSGNVIGSIRPPTSNTALQIAHLFRNQFVNSSVMVKRTAIEKSMIFDESRGKRFAEDYDLWLRVSKSGLIANIPEELTAYRRFHGSRSQSNGKSLLDSARDISAGWLHQHTNLFISIDSARSFVMTVNGLDDLSPSTGCKVKNSLQTYDSILNELQLANTDEDSREFRKVMNRHKLHIFAWSLIGFIPIRIQRSCFSILNSLKASRFTQLVVTKTAMRGSNK